VLTNRHINGDGQTDGWTDRRAGGRDRALGTRRKKGGVRERERGREYARERERGGETVCFVMSE
jgi:hypothetical protein